MIKRNKAIAKILTIAMSTSLINTGVAFAATEPGLEIAAQGTTQGSNLNVKNINNSNDSTSFSLTATYDDVLGVVTTTSASVTFNLNDGPVQIVEGTDPGTIKIMQGRGYLEDGNAIDSDDEIDENIDIIITGGTTSTFYNVLVSSCMPNIIIREAYTTGDINGGNITMESGKIGNVIGGYSSGDKAGGTVKIESGTVQGDVKGGESKSGVGGAVTISGGTVQSVYGGNSLSGNGGAVTIEGGTAQSVVGGASNSGTGGSVTMSGGEVEYRVGGGDSYGTDSTGAGGAVIMSGGKVKKQVQGGNSYGTGAGGAVIISGGTVEQQWVAGGNSSGGAGGAVTISGGTVGGVYGGNYFSGTKVGVLTINGGSIKGVQNPIPKNENSQTVYKNKVQLPISSDEEVTCNIDNSGATWKATTLDIGCLYVYLPESTGSDFHIIEVTDGSGNIYIYKVATNVDGSSVAVESVILKEQPASSNVTVGNINETLKVNANASTGKTLNYQWYSNSTESTIGGTAITDATSEEFIIPVDSPVGEKYYYCVVSATGIDSATSNVAKVVVANKVYVTNATAGEHGSISPSGDTSIVENASQSYTITPEAGYEISDVLVDGVSVGAVSSYKFENVTSAHTISATFKVKNSSTSGGSSTGGSSSGDSSTSGGSSSSGSSSSGSSSSATNGTETVVDSINEASIISAITSGTAKTIVINVSNANSNGSNAANSGSEGTTPSLSENILKDLKANPDKTLVIKSVTANNGTSTIEIKSTVDGQIQFTQNNEALAGFITIGNAEYYLNSNGIMQTGWVQLPGNTFYYLNQTTGVKEKGWVKDYGTWYYLDKTSGEKKTGWVQDNGKWYYLNNDGKMKTNWVNDNGSWYYLNADGTMQTGWFKDSDGRWYYLEPSGAMAKDTTIDGYYVNGSGAWSN